MRSLPDKVKQLVQDKAVFAHFATLMEDGSPHVSPVWVDVDGDTLIVNSAEGRVKDRNVRHDARVALSFTDPDNSYDFVTVRGRVVQITSEGADAHIDRMAKKYLNADKYPFRGEGEVRVVYRIEPEKLVAR